MKGEIWVRRRQQPAKRRFYHFVEHTTKHNEEKGIDTSGWIIKTASCHEEGFEINFIPDENIEAFKSKSRNRLVPQEDVARMVLTGEISAGIL